MGLCSWEKCGQCRTPEAKGPDHLCEMLLWDWGLDLTLLTPLMVDESSDLGSQAFQSQALIVAPESARHRHK